MKEHVDIQPGNSSGADRTPLEITLPDHPLILRYSGTEESTLGLFFVNRKFQHYIIEDSYRAEKIAGITRIAAGIYPLVIRTVGGFHNRYMRKFSEIHKGMIWITNVPEFEYILYHIGNKADNSAGCVLSGDVANNNQLVDGFVSSSTNAYKRTYPKLIDYINENSDPVIEIVDMDRQQPFLT